MKLSRFVVTATLIGVVAGRAAAQSVSSPPPPPPSPGAVVNGTVRLPNGLLALRNPSSLQRFAALLVPEAEALTSTNVRAVGRNVGVQLSQRRGDGAVQTFDTFFTNDQGQFLMYLPSGTSADTCRFMLSVGSGQTLTRAFVYSTTEPIVVDYASETAVALVLDRVRQGTDLCAFSTGEIRSLVNAIRALPGDVTGADIFETNHNALLITENAMGPFGAEVGGVPTPVATVTPKPTQSPTITPTPGGFPIGASCTSRTQCLSGICANDLCCNTCESEFCACGCDGRPLPTPTLVPNSEPETCVRDGKDGLLVQSFDGCECLPLCPYPTSCSGRRSVLVFGRCMDLEKCSLAVTPTPTPTISVCIGDCNSDGSVTVDELMTGINIALGTANLSACPAPQCPSSGPSGIFIDCFIIAVNNLLNGCPTPTPVDPVPGPYEASGLIHAGDNPSEFLVGQLDITIPLVMSGVPNMAFEYAVENSEWRSQSFEIVQTGDPGEIYASTFNLGVVFMGLSVRIDGEVVQLFGSGEYSFDADLRLILFKVNLTGGGYTVTLTAIPADASAPRKGE